MIILASSTGCVPRNAKGWQAFKDEVLLPCGIDRFDAFLSLPIAKQFAAVELMDANTHPSQSDTLAEAISFQGDTAIDGAILQLQSGNPQSLVPLVEIAQIIRDCQPKNQKYEKLNHVLLQSIEQIHPATTKLLLRNWLAKFLPRESCPTTEGVRDKFRQLRPKSKCELDSQ